MDKDHRGPIKAPSEPEIAEDLPQRDIPDEPFAPKRITTHPAFATALAVVEARYQETMIDKDRKIAELASENRVLKEVKALRESDVENLRNAILARESYNQYAVVTSNERQRRAEEIETFCKAKIKEAKEERDHYIEQTRHSRGQEFATKYHSLFCSRVTPNFVITEDKFDEAFARFKQLDERLREEMLKSDERKQEARKREEEAEKAYIRSRAAGERVIASEAKSRDRIFKEDQRSAQKERELLDRQKRLDIQEGKFVQTIVLTLSTCVFVTVIATIMISWGN